MNLAEARALCPHARMPQCHYAESAGGPAGTLVPKISSPTVAVDADGKEMPDGLLLDVTGGAHLFGSEHLLLTELAGRWADRDWSRQTSPSPTVGGGLVQI